MVRVNLPEHAAEALTREASLRGMTLEQYLVSLARNGSANGSHGEVSKEEAELRVARMREWFSKQPVRRGLADDSRESIY